VQTNSIQVNSCSIIDSEHHNSGHFKVFKVSTSTIRIIFNDNLSNKVKFKISNQTNKLLGTVYSTSEPIALGYTNSVLQRL